jgi:hypothetical protein
MPRYWRIRVKDYSSEDRFPQGWARGEVGLWYGAWSANDFVAALKTVDPAKYLSAVPAQQELKWSISKEWVDTVKRFYNIKGEDWLFAYYDEHLWLARATGAMESKSDHPFNVNRELFKLRMVGDKKQFHLRRLPDSFRLLASAGRGNVHEVHGTRPLIELLANSKNEDEVNNKIDAMPFQKWMDILGPNSWESMCMGYLIRVFGFAPTGLSLGKTLPVFDIVGVDANNCRIFGQCKKNVNKEKMDSEFLAAARQSVAGERLFYFAYGGITGPVPPNVEAMTGEKLIEWFEGDSDGQQYMRAWKLER